MALVYTLLKPLPRGPRSSTIWPNTLCAVIFHLFPPAHRVQDAHCICLPQACTCHFLDGMFYSIGPCFIPSLPSCPCFTCHRILSDRCTYAAVPLQLSLPFAPSPQRIESRPLSSLSTNTGHLIPLWALVFMLPKCNLWTTRWPAMGECHLPLSKCRVARAWWGRWRRKLVDYPGECQHCSVR